MGLIAPGAKERRGNRCHFISRTYCGAPSTPRLAAGRVAGPHAGNAQRRGAAGTSPYCPMTACRFARSGGPPTSTMSAPSRKRLTAMSAQRMMTARAVLSNGLLAPCTEHLGVCIQSPRRSSRITPPREYRRSPSRANCSENAKPVPLLHRSPAMLFLRTAVLRCSSTRSSETRCISNARLQSVEEFIAPEEILRSSLAGPDVENSWARPAGLTFAFSRNRFVGSYLFLSATRRG